MHLWGMSSHHTISTTVPSPSMPVSPTSASSVAPSPPSVTPDTPLVAVEIESGPAVDGACSLAAGRHVVGRARGVAIHVADPLVEPHHLLLDVALDGTCTVLHLAGRLPVVVDGQPASGWVRVVAGATIDLGATRLRLRPAGRPPVPPHTGEVPGDPWRRMLVRSPRAVPFLALAAVEPPVSPSNHPVPPPRAGMLVGGMAGLLAGLVMAVVTGSPLAALFGVMAAVVSTTTWTVGRIRSFREERRRRRTAENDLETFTEAVVSAAERIRRHHTVTTVSVARRLTDVDDHELWSRREDHGDAFVVSIGRGDLERPVPVAGGGDAVVTDHHLAVVDRHRVLHDVQVPVDLAAHDQHVVAIEGEGADAVARGVLAQLAISAGPADWCLRVVARDIDHYGWTARLPHAAAHDGRPVIVDAAGAEGLAALALGLDDADTRRVVLVCDAPGLLATRTGPIRRLLDAARPITILLVVDHDAGLPAVCRSVLRLGSRGVGRWIADLHDADSSATWASIRVHTSGVTSAVAERVVEQLARFVDPEDPMAAAGRLPRSLRLSELSSMPGSAVEVASAWTRAGRDPALAAVIGTSIDGVIEIDLVRDGPHGLVAGTTGSGKSELLRTLVVALAARVGPDHLSFVLVDYKGGATFDACASLPHTVGVVTDLDGRLAERALRSLEAELHRRERLLRTHGVADLPAYRQLDGVVPLPRLVVVIDEFAALAKELPDFLAALVGVAQRGRSLGLHLVLATQRPAGVVDDAIRANTNLRIALRLHDVSDALDVVGDRGPAGFARGIPGRVMLRLGPDEVVEFQAASCTVVRPDGTAPRGGSAGSAPSELTTLVTAIRGAAELLDVAPPHRPWLPSLDEVGPEVVHEVVRAIGPVPGMVGVVDDPGAQRRGPLSWDMVGNLALVGALGSGTTTALRSIAHTVARDRPHVAIHVIDARGDASLGPVATLDGCAGVIRVHEQERLGRALRRLVTAIDDRRRGADPADDHDVAALLMVDGLATLRRTLDDPGRGDEAAALDRILAEGPAVGVVTAAVVEADGSSAHAVLARFAERWVFHLDDPAIAPMLGVPTSCVPGAVPGRVVPGRVVVATSGLEGQVFAVDPPPAGGSRADTPVARIEVLPSSIDVRQLPAIVTGSTSVPVGHRFDDLEVAHLPLVPGDRLVVAGPPGSGRSSLLRLLVRQWRQVHPDHEVMWWRDADPELDGGPEPARERLVVIDDSDRIEDPGGRLAAIVSTRRADTTVVLAGRADALRAGFDHWSVPARRHRLGFVMAATSELDGDVLGVAPPRRCPIRPRPGLAWMIAHGAHTLVQTAVPDG